MERKKTNLTVVKRICFLVGAVVSLWLSFSSFIASTWRHGDVQRSSFSNPFILASMSPEQSEIDEIVTQLDFMVWPQERQTLATDLRQRLHEKINQAPFNGYLWRQLSFAQKHAGLGFSERIWTIENARLLNRWNIQENLVLSHHCFLDYAKFKQVSDQFCSAVLAQLPSQNSSAQLAKRVGVNAARVQAVLDQEGLEISGDRK